MENQRLNSPIRHRWFRFRLRTFLLFVTAVCIALGMYVKRERDRYEAIETIKLWGGGVTFAPSPILPAGQEINRRQLLQMAAIRGISDPGLPEYRPQSKGWLRRMFGRYGKYHGADVYGVEISSRSFRRNGVIYEPPVDFAILAAISEVEYLTFDKVDGESMSQLPRFPHLESLNLPSRQVDDACLEPLDRMPRLQQLKIPEAVLTERGMAAIGSRTELTSLDLSRCYLDDAGFAHFVDLPLQKLMLNLTTTSDAAAPYISKLKGLKELHIKYTKMTEVGVRLLKQELPDCRIEHDCHWLEYATAPAE